MGKRILILIAVLILLGTSIPTTAISDNGNSAVSFRDDFDGALASGWEWIRPDSANWSSTANPGHLRITTQYGELWGNSWHRPLGNNLKNLLVRDAPDGDFEIVTKVNFAPTFFHHQAAIVIYQDDDNYIRLSREYSSQRCGFARETGTTQDVFIRQTIRPIVAYTTTYLKIKKTGNIYTGYYSDDGNSWTRIEGTELETNTPNINSFVADLDNTNLKVGLYACSGLYEAGGSEGQKDADFDYFEIIPGQSTRKNDGEAPGCGGTHQLAINNAIDRGLEYLRGQQQNDGSWICSRAGAAKVGGTALTVLAFLSQLPEETAQSDPAVSTGIEFILSKVQDDGSIWTDSGHKTYDTSCALMTLGKTENAQYAQTISNARQWLIDTQNDEPEYQPDNKLYGGWGYPRANTADLSNTQYALIALAATSGGIPSDSANKLITFLETLRNSNGGFAYSPGRSPWASMTAAGIWCLYLTGVGKNDARVQGALNWFDTNYNYDRNPGYGEFKHYYLWTAAKAFYLYDITDRYGILDPPDNWNSDLCNDKDEYRGKGWYYDFSKHLVDTQNNDGSWSSSGSGIICDTVFALLVLGKELVVPTGGNVYFDPENSCAQYCKTRDVEIRVDAINFKSGQILLEYDPNCAEIADWIPNREYFDSTIDRSTPPGEEWITFYAVDPHESLTGDYLIGTLKIHCISEAECTTTLDFVTSGQTPSTLFDNQGYQIPAIWKDGTFSCIKTCPDDGDDDGDDGDDDGDGCDPDGTCGDVAPSGECDGLINMGDVGLLHNFVGDKKGEYTLCCCDNWCGDVAPVDPDDPAVTCDGIIDMGDVGLLHNYVAYPRFGYYLCCQEAGAANATLVSGGAVEFKTASENSDSFKSMHLGQLINLGGMQPGMVPSGPALFASINLSTGSIVVAQSQGKVYLDPPDLHASHGDTEEIEIRVDATSFKSGQLTLQYDPTSSEVTDWEINEDDFSGTWDSDTPGEEWITFLAQERALDNDYLIGTLTLEGLCEEECSTTLDFAGDRALFNDWGRRIPVTWSGGTFEVSSGPDEGGGASDWPLISGLIAVGFAVFAFIFIILLRSRRQIGRAT